MTKPQIAILGAGPAGEAAAKQGAVLGADVTLIEKDQPGGLCLNHGCIPSKILLETVHLAHKMKTASACFDNADAPRLRWTELQKRKQDIILKMRDWMKKHMSQVGVRLTAGRARFTDSRTLRIEGDGTTSSLPFDAALIATGGEPIFPEPFLSHRKDLLDSARALDLPAPPKSLIVVGGGAIGCEFACLFHALGSSVSLIEKMSQLIPGEETRVVTALKNSFSNRGIDVRLDTTVASLTRGTDRWEAVLSDGTVLRAEQILVSIGRRPTLDELGLDLAGVKTDRGRILVDDFLRTSQPHIYAAGDINGLSPFAHSAARQGETAIHNAVQALLGKTPDLKTYDKASTPRCLYTWPEVASVGEYADAIQQRGGETKVQRFFFQASPKAMAEWEEEGFIQILSDAGDEGRLRGAQIVGAHATELIHIFSTALRAGMTRRDLGAVLFAHPTLSEGIKETLSR
ncbi:MAG TPA: NAD(P)/FAD-dependent oxidoreductase [Elusimicrobiota bacterium]|nr:NAD(P)/FAD-dependent oxidoreductase [Elusimicrobiota bacterium]